MIRNEASVKMFAQTSRRQQSGGGNRKHSQPKKEEQPSCHGSDSRGNIGRQNQPVASTDNSTLVFPFLQDSDTSQYIMGSKVMLILRGLPGSGKSFIAHKTQQKYKKFCSVFSADDFFLRNGVYKYNGSKLKDAHELCQQKAFKACKEGKSLVVIDNTNVKISEMDYYIGLAQQMGYLPLIIQPLTPWKLLPIELAIKNHHGLTQEKIEKKLQQWEDIVPLYAGWFLNECDSMTVTKIAVAYLQSCMRISEFQKDFTTLMLYGNVRGLDEYFKLDIQLTSPHLLHCTASYFGDSMEALQSYWRKERVKKSYGKVFPLEIVGFVATPDTLGARLKLTKEERNLWVQDDFEQRPCSPRGIAEISHGLSSLGVRSMPGEQNHHVSTSTSSSTSQELLVRTRSCKTLGTCTLRSFNDKSVGSLRKFQPTAGKGRRAHLTIGCAEGVSPVQAGFDLMAALDLEQRAASNQRDIVTYSIPGGHARKYANGIWVIYLDEMFLVDGLFASYVNSSEC